MITLIRNCVVILLLFIAFTGCKDDELPDPNKIIWQEMKHFTGRNKILLNSLGTPNALYVYGIGRITVITDPDSSGVYSYKDWAGFEHTDILHKPMMHPDFILAGNHGNTIRLIRTQSYWGHSENLRIPLDNFDSSISRLDINRYWFGTYLKINNNKQVLIRVDHDSMGPDKYILATVDKPYYNLNDRIDLKYIDVSNNWGTDFACSIDEYFFIGDSRMYRIDTSGNYLLVSNDIMLRHPFKYSFDKSSNEVYMGISQNDYVVISYDKGLSWQNFSSQPISDLNRFQFINLDGEILGFHSRWGIIHLKITEDVIELKQIDTEGITNEITSLSKFKNDFVVTTFSGAFKKSASEFFTYRN